MPIIRIANIFSLLIACYYNFIWGWVFQKKNAETYLTQSNVWIFFFLYYVLSNVWIFFLFILCTFWVVFETPSLPWEETEGEPPRDEEMRRVIFVGFSVSALLRIVPHMSILCLDSYSFALKELSCYLKIYILNIMLLWDSCLLRQKKDEWLYSEEKIKNKYNVSVFVCWGKEDYQFAWKGNP